MTGDTYIRVDDAGWYQPYRLAGDGLTKVDVARPFATPREAIDFCNHAAANAAARGAEIAPGVDSDSGPRSSSRFPGRPGASYSVDPDPASRSAAHSDLAGLGAASRDGDQPPTEAPDGVSTSGPAAGLPPSAAGVSPASRLLLSAAAADRFWLRVDQSGGLLACWPWTGARNSRGYGHVRIGPDMVVAHRVALAQARPEATGPMALHSCDNRLCCNPAHLRWGTARENVQDMDERGRRARLHRCARGHELVGANVRTDRTGRHCRRCDNEGRLRRCRMARQTPATT